MNQQPRESSTIVLPLYQYPLRKNTWDPLFDAISSNLDVAFVVIINPNSGPGVDPDGWLPDKRYMRDIDRLKEFPNVTLIGYVRLDYCRRSLDEVCQDIAKYANWKRHTPGIFARMVGTAPKQLAMEGVFFDEVPNIFTESVADYLATVGDLVKKSEGLMGERMIIHNPGTVPDPEFFETWSLPKSGIHDQSAAHRHGAPDAIVVFEGSYNDWLEEAIQQRMTRLLRYGRSQCCYMLHSVPIDHLPTIVEEVKVKGAYLFVTDLCEKYYESFGVSWQPLIEAISNGNK